MAYDADDFAVLLHGIEVILNRLLPIRIAPAFGCLGECLLLGFAPLCTDQQGQGC